ncbi:MAG: phage tail tube protein [Rhodospirillaceae bacterium]|nr:phage tail tube protein [Rhodospirillaceae bacterium]
MSSNRVAGVAFIKVDGEQYALRGNLTVNIDAFTRTGVAGQDGVHGYTEAPQVPFISGDISDSAGLPLQDIAKITDSTVVAELANGKSYILRNAWAAESRELNAAEGTISVRFEGMQGEEIKP